MQILEREIRIMKKIVAAFLLLTFALALVGCGADNSTSEVSTVTCPASSTTVSSTTTKASSTTAVRSTTAVCAHDYQPVYEAYHFRGGCCYCNALLEGTDANVLVCYKCTECGKTKNGVTDPDIGVATFRCEMCGTVFCVDTANGEIWMSADDITTNNIAHVFRG